MTGWSAFAQGRAIGRQPTCRGITRGLGDGVRYLAFVGVVRPGALHRVRAVAHAHVRRGALTGGDPGALVRVLLAGLGIGPAARRVLIGQDLGVLVAADDREAIEDAGGAAVDEVRAAARPEVRHVRQVRVRDVPERGGGEIVPAAESSGGAGAVR